MTEVNTNIEGTDLDNQLWSAVESGNIEAVKTCIAAGGDVCISRGISLVVLGVEKGHWDIVKYLLSLKAVQENEAKSDQNALMYAIEYHSSEVVGQLLQAGADPNLASPYKRVGALGLYLNIHECRVTGINDDGTYNIVLSRDKSTESAVKIVLRPQGALFYAVEKDSVQVLKLLIGAGADVNRKDHYNRIALHYGAANGATEVLKLLIDAGADVNVSDRDKVSPLRLSVENGVVDAVKVLIDAGTDVNAKDKVNFLSYGLCVMKAFCCLCSGMTALHYGAKNGAGDVVKLLIDAGADITVKAELGERTALHYGASTDAADMMKLLIDLGADVNASDSSSKTALHYGAANGSVEVIKLLINAGATLIAQDRYSRTILHYGAERGSVEVVQALINAGADVNVEDPYQKPVLHCAVGSGATDVVKLLIEAGANVNALDHNAESVLHCAAKSGSVDMTQLLINAGADEATTALRFGIEAGVADVVKLLIDAGADVNVKNNYGDSLLHCGAEKGSADVVKLLIDAGCNVNEKDRHGRTALHWGAGTAGVVKLLIDHGADINSVDYNACTALHVSATSTTVDTAKLLIHSNANVHLKNKNGKTALHHCAEKGSAELVKLLIEAGVDVNEKDKMMKAPLHHAVRSESIDAVRLLIIAGANVNEKDGDEMTPIFYGAQRNAADLVKLLIDADAHTALIANDGGLVRCALYDRDVSQINITALNLVSHGGVHSVVDGVPTVSPLFTESSNRKLKEAICTVDFLSSCQLHMNNYDVWNQVVQVSDVDGIEDVVRSMVISRPELASVRDAKGRLAVDLAAPKIKFIINSVTLWFGKYRPAVGKPEHTSATCFVYKAMDESGAEHCPVALKLMRIKAQFKRETDMRKYEFDGECVMSQIDSYPRRELTDDAADAAAADVIDVSSLEESSGVLSKTQAERLYCVVMPLAERNLFVAMKQERFAGKEDVSEVVTIFSQMVKCVAHMHGRGVLHGDIKPMNLVRMGGKWLLIDLDACCVIGRDSVGFKSSSAYVPPEAVYADASEGVVAVRSASVRSRHAGCELLVAAESFDVWSLGCILYQLCSDGVLPLFAANQDDNLNSDINDTENSLWSLCEWSETLKEKKLSKVTNLKARNLLSLMLSKDASKRPSLSRVLGHPFLSGDSSAGRMAGEAAEFDVFLSYRVWSDLQYAEKLYAALTAAGLRVWWDKVCLESGKEWQSGFCQGLGTSSAFVCILSEAGTDGPFQSLHVESNCDNVLLEHRLALELKQIDYIKYVFPIMVGGAKEYRGSRNESRSHVSTVEEALKGYMNELGLGTPLKSRPSVFDVESEIRQCQGFFVDDCNADHSMDKAVEGIVKALKNQTQSGVDDVGVMRSSKSVVSSLRAEVISNKPHGYVSAEEVESILEQQETLRELLAKERRDREALVTKLDSALAERDSALAERDQLLNLLNDLKTKYESQRLLPNMEVHES